MSTRTKLWVGLLAPCLTAILLLAFSPTAQAYGLTQCAGDRFGSNLGCTANDVQITQITATGGPSSCKAGDFITLNFAITINSGSPNRWDIGVFLSNDGKDPELTQASGGSSSCSVSILPTTAPFLNLNNNTCGDVNGSMNPTLIGGVSSANQGILYMNGVTVKCQSKDGAGGNLYVPFVVSWNNQSSGLCQTAADPVPNTTSKCNAPGTTVTLATVVGIVVLPKIEKSDGVTVVAPGQTTNYSIVITNNTGAALGATTPDATNAVFKDAAVSYLTANSVSCTPSGGATCPSAGNVTVAAMQGSGIQLPQMPAGSSVTFTVNATVAANTSLGTLITNTATVTTSGQTNSASDTNTVGTTSLNHYELSLPTQSIACAPTTVTVTACADSTSPCTNIYSAVGGNATLSTTAGTLATTTPGFTSGAATTTLSNTGASNGATATVTLSSVTTSAPNPTLCCPNGRDCVARNNCTTTYVQNGLYFTNTSGGNPAPITTQTSGVTSGTFYLRAVNTGKGGACTGALSGSNTVSLGYECNNPATCYASNLMKIDTGPVTMISRNNDNNMTTYTNVNMTFDTNGYAPFTLEYQDVGMVTLWAKYSTTLTGASNPFVVKPYNFLLSNIKCTNSGDCAAGNTSSPNNPGAANYTGLPFMKAGSPFSATVTAINAHLVATPSYGMESPPQGVKLTPNLVSPSGGNNPAVGNLTAFGSFTNGVATGTTFSWGEVGIITLTPSVDDGNYLSAGDVIGSASGNVGRFIPHHFNVTAIPGCSGGATFTYSGQPFTATATAVNASGTTTLNYYGNTTPIFAQTTTFSDASGATTCTNNTLAATGYTSGVGSDSTLTCTFPAKETAAQSISGRAVDADGVSSSGYTEAAMPTRSGRARLFNAYGSELLDLAVPMRVQYYLNSSDGWVTSADDTCSAVTLRGFTNYQRNLSAGKTCVQDTGNPGVSGQGCSAVGPVAELYVSPPSSGGYNLYLKAPGAGNNGSVDLTANLSSYTWLKYNWTGAGESETTGKATFGTWHGNPRNIHLRELY